MKLEHFLYGMMNGEELELRTSNGIQSLLTDEELLMLCHIGDKETRETVKEYCTNKWLSISYIKPMTDKHGRRANWNHTVVIKLTDYLGYTQPRKLVQQHFIKESSQIPAKLKALVLGE